MRDKVLYSAIYDGSYPFKELFGEVTTILKPEEMVDDDATLVIWGGGDISPSLYGHGVSHHTGASEVPSKRDVIEWDLANKAVSMGIPVIGICRGAQMMCARAGGYLIQDVTGHTQRHLITTKDGKRIWASSLHHQMMAFGPEQEAEVIAVSTERLSKHYIIENDVDIAMSDAEPEIVWFPSVKALAIQGHPEFLEIKAEFVQYTFQLIEEYVHVA